MLNQKSFVYSSIYKGVVHMNSLEKILWLRNNAEHPAKSMGMRRSKKT